jgi:hypothetical protein
MGGTGEYNRHFADKVRLEAARCVGAFPAFSPVFFFFFSTDSFPFFCKGRLRVRRMQPASLHGGHEGALLPPGSLVLL